MKVYSTPVPWPEPDYKNYDRDVEAKREADHRKSVETWLRANGYAGERTGEVLRLNVADGYAQYMFGHGLRGDVLIHLPYVDAYSYLGIEHFPKREILEMLDREKRMAAIFENANS